MAAPFSKGFMLDKKDEAPIDVKTDFEIMADWQREIDNHLLIIGKKKTGRQRGEEISKELAAEKAQIDKRNSDMEAKYGPDWNKPEEKPKPDLTIVEFVEPEEKEVC